MKRLNSLNDVLSIADESYRVGVVKRRKSGRYLKTASGWKKLESKSQDFSNIIESVDLICPNCEDNLGSDRENSNPAYCGNCDHSFPNPRGYKNEDNAVKTGYCDCCDNPREQCKCGPDCPECDCNAIEDNYNEASKCAVCKKNPALEKSVRAARIEDIEDGNTIDIEKNICGSCLQELADEAARIANGEYDEAYVVAKKDADFGIHGFVHKGDKVKVARSGSDHYLLDLGKSKFSHPRSLNVAKVTAAQFNSYFSSEEKPTIEDQSASVKDPKSIKGKDMTKDKKAELGKSLPGKFVRSGDLDTAKKIMNQDDKMYSDCDCDKEHELCMCSKCKDHAEYCPETGTNCCGSTKIEHGESKDDDEFEKSANEPDPDEYAKLVKYHREAMRNHKPGTEDYEFHKGQVEDAMRYLSNRKQ